MGKASSLKQNIKRMKNVIQKSMEQLENRTQKIIFMHFMEKFSNHKKGQTSISTSIYDLHEHLKLNEINISPLEIDKEVQIVIKHISNFKDKNPELYK